MHTGGSRGPSGEGKMGDGVVGGKRRSGSVWWGKHVIWFAKDLNVLHEFRIEERESHKLVLIQIHHEQLVSRRQIQLVGRELLVEVADIFTMFLYSRKSEREREREIEKKRKEKKKETSREEQQQQWQQENNGTEGRRKRKTTPITK